jgi:hypothetical protein
MATQQKNKINDIQIKLLDKVSNWAKENSINGKIETLTIRGYINYLILKLNGK